MNKAYAETQILNAAKSWLSFCEVMIDKTAKENNYMGWLHWLAEFNDTHELLNGLKIPYPTETMAIYKDND